MARADIEKIVREVAGQYKFPEVDVLLATVHQESGFRPDAVGDSGNSRGIFQENIRGRGAGLTPEQSFDPRASTVRAIQEFNRYRKPGQSPGDWAAAAQRPADRAGYSRNINAWLGQGNAGAPVAAAASADDPAWYREYFSQQGAPQTPQAPRQAQPAERRVTPSGTRTPSGWAP